MPESPTSILTPPSGGPSGRFTRSGGSPPEPPKRARPKVKKLRLAFLLLGLGVLALISTVFGMLMAVASDLPALENKAEYAAAKNSVLYADLPGCKESDTKNCSKVARLTGNQNRILLTEDQISPNIKNAVIAIEDRRFYEHGGVDYKGIARAFSQDLLRRSAAQGGSTITQQFVKNALSAQGNRSVFQKLREAALAYHLERKWSKDKILTQYLNTVYFGNGAYGVESAVRAYFRPPTLQPDGSTGYSNGDQAADVTPAEAALLAGMIASPSLYDPVENPRHATARRNLVLNRMLEQQVHHPRAVPRGGRARKVPAEVEHQPARPRLLAAVLLELADPAAGGPLPAGGGVRRRPEDQDHDRHRPAAGGRAGHLRPAERLRAERLTGGHPEQHGRGQGHGRRQQLQGRTPSTSPPTGIASRDRPSSPSHSCARWPTA